MSKKQCLNEKSVAQMVENAIIVTKYDVLTQVQSFIIRTLEDDKLNFHDKVSQVYGFVTANIKAVEKISKKYKQEG